MIGNIISSRYHILQKQDNKSKKRYNEHLTDNEFYMSYSVLFLCPKWGDI